MNPSPSCGFTFLLSTKNGKTLGVLPAPPSFLTLLCWSFYGPGNIISSLGYLTNSYGCVQWFWSLSSLISAEWVTRSTWLTLMDVSSDSRVFLRPPYSTVNGKSPSMWRSRQSHGVALPLFSLCCLRHSLRLSSDRRQTAGLWAAELPFTQAAVSSDSEQQVWLCSSFHFQLPFLAYLVDFQRNNSKEHPTCNYVFLIATQSKC